MRSAANAGRYDVGDRLQCRRRRAGGGGRRLRSARDARRHRLEDLHHEGDDAQRRARRCTGWRKAGVDDPYGRVIALTAAPDKAIEFGVDETRILPFSESVGGRYSLWSSIGFPAALALGWDAFESLLEGAAAMDRHFRLAPPDAQRAGPRRLRRPLLRQRPRRRDAARSSPMTSGCGCCPPISSSSRWNRTARASRLDGAPVGRATAPIIWGGVGTDAQHAVFQLLHQGTHLVPVEFVAAIEPGDGLDPEHHHQLLINCFAQGAALMAGRASDDPAPLLSRRPAVDDDPARPARSGARSARCSPFTSTAPSPMRSCSGSTRSTSSASSSARKWRRRSMTKAPWPSTLDQVIARPRASETNANDQDLRL